MSDKSGSGSDGDENFDEAYEVEEIRDKQRGEDGEYLYYVKWVGWDSDTNTWEPKDHLADCPDKLEEFERRWRKRQDAKLERRREEKERRRRERRERELKAAARFKVDSDSDGGYDRGSLEVKKEKKKIVADSSSDSDSDDRAKRKEKHKKHKEDRDRKRDRSREREKEKKKERQPKFFKDIKPEKILGVTTDPGELYFYIKWEGDKAEPGLVKAKEAYQKIPIMCCKFYEKHLVWNKMAKPVDVKPETDGATAAPLAEGSETKPVSDDTSANNADGEKAEKAPEPETTKKEDDDDDDLPAPVPADA